MSKMLLAFDAGEDIVSFFEHNQAPDEATIALHELRAVAIPAFLLDQTMFHGSPNAETCTVCEDEFERIFTRGHTQEDRP